MVSTRPAFTNGGGGTTEDSTEDETTDEQLDRLKKFLRDEDVARLESGDTDSTADSSDSTTDLNDRTEVVLDRSGGGMATPRFVTPEEKEQIEQEREQAEQERADRVIASDSLVIPPGAEGPVLVGTFGTGAPGAANTELVEAGTVTGTSEFETTQGAETGPTTGDQFEATVEGKTVRGTKADIASEVESQFLRQNPQFNREDVKVVEQGDGFTVELTQSGAETAVQTAASKSDELGFLDIEIGQTGTGVSFGLSPIGEETVKDIEREKAAEQLSDRLGIKLSKRDVKKTATGWTVTDNVRDKLRGQQRREFAEDVSKQLGTTVTPSEVVLTDGVFKVSEEFLTDYYEQQFETQLSSAKADVLGITDPQLRSGINVDVPESAIEIGGSAVALSDEFLQSFMTEQQAIATANSKAEVISTFKTRYPEAGLTSADIEFTETDEGFEATLSESGRKKVRVSRSELVSAIRTGPLGFLEGTVAEDVAAGGAGLGVDIERKLESVDVPVVEDVIEQAPTEEELFDFGRGLVVAGAAGVVAPEPVTSVAGSGAVITGGAILGTAAAAGLAGQAFLPGDLGDVEEARERLDESEIPVTGRMELFPSELDVPLGRPTLQEIPVGEGVLPQPLTLLQPEDTSPVEVEDGEVTVPIQTEGTAIQRPAEPSVPTEQGPTITGEDLAGPTAIIEEQRRIEERIGRRQEGVLIGEGLMPMFEEAAEEEIERLAEAQEFLVEEAAITEPEVTPPADVAQRSEVTQSVEDVVQTDVAQQQDVSVAQETAVAEEVTTAVENVQAVNVMAPGFEFQFEFEYEFATTAVAAPFDFGFGFGTSEAEKTADSSDIPTVDLGIGQPSGALSADELIPPGWLVETVAGAAFGIDRPFEVEDTDGLLGENTLQLTAEEQEQFKEAEELLFG